MPRKKIGFALGSGSARGLAHIGVLKVLKEAGISIDCVAGSSIGAIIGGMFSAGMKPEEIENIANSMNILKLVSLADVTLPNTAILNGNRVEKFIREKVGNKNFEELKIPFKCVAVDVLSGKEIVLDSGSVAKALRASISLPVIFAPVEKDGQLLVDGGVLNPVPVDIVKSMGADIVIAVTLSGNYNGKPMHHRIEKEQAEKDFSDRENRENSPKVYYSKNNEKNKKEDGKSFSAYQLAIQSFDLMQRELSIPKLKKADIVIAPHLKEVPVYGFHDAKKIIELGERTCLKALEEIKKLEALRSV